MHELLFMPVMRLEARPALGRRSLHQPAAPTNPPAIYVKHPRHLRIFLTHDSALHVRSNGLIFGLITAYFSEAVIREPKSIKKIIACLDEKGRGPPYTAFPRGSCAPLIARKWRPGESSVTRVFAPVEIRLKLNTVEVIL
ncbi:MAG TPA: hypothetical protein ENN69_09080 [Spirochaetia bacterium]|nr:hypothetical protein [Spirochaetia bacterium]